MVKRRIGILFASILLALATTLPAYATAGDAKLVVVDQFVGNTLTTCTTAISPCNINLIAGHTYIATLTEISGAQFRAGTLDGGSSPASKWSPRYGGWSYNGNCTNNPITYFDDGTTWRVIANGLPLTANCVNYMELSGVVTDSGTDGIMRAIVRLANGTQTGVTVNYATP